MKVSLSLQKNEGDTKHRVDAEFSREDIALLRRYQDFVERLSQARLLVRGLPKITKINFGGDTGLEIKCGPYENSELYELLHLLRPLILKNEATSFHNIAAILNKRFKNELVGGHLKYLRRYFENGELSLYMGLKIADQDIFNESLLRLWLNSEEYHTDPEKIPAWAAVKNSLKTENTRAVVMSLLGSKIEALFDLAHICNLISSADVA